MNYEICQEYYPFKLPARALEEHKNNANRLRI